MADDDEDTNDVNDDDDEDNKKKKKKALLSKRKVTAQSYGAIDIRNIHQECWLLRIPPKLAQIFHDAPEGSAIGQLVLTKGSSAAATSSKKTGGGATATATVTSIKPAATSRQHQQQKTSISMQLDSTLEGVTSDTPLAYSLQAMTSKIPCMMPFTRHPNASIQLHGTVTRTANLQVDSTDARYKQLTRNRLLQSNVDRSRYVKPVDANELSVKKSGHVKLAANTAAAQNKNSEDGTGVAGFGDAVQEFGKRKLEVTELLNNAGGLAAAAAAAASSVSTTALGDGAGAGGGDNDEDDEQATDPSNILSSSSLSAAAAAKRLKTSAASTAAQFEGQTTRSVMFALFSKQPYWTVKDLRVASGGRVEREIRDILRDIGEYHRSGEHKNMWQLRSEFQQQL